MQSEGGYRRRAERGAGKMRLTLGILLLMLLVPAYAFAGNGDDPSATKPSLDSLRLQLIEVQARETELQIRAQQLDEEMKPENIEHSLAGIGSTKPEELREARRRQLSIEREGVQTQLKLLGVSRERLESSIRIAETKAYQQSAAGPSTPLNQALASKSLNRVGILIGLVGLAALAITFAVVRRVYVSGK